MDSTTTFIATFAGVLLSFLLWLLGEHIVKQLSKRKERQMMHSEVVDEIRNNIFLLDNNIKFVQKSLNDGEDVPMYIPRLLRTSTIYAISSGNVRFLKNREERILVYGVDALYEAHNRFIENTEQIFALLLLRPDSTEIVKLRVKQYQDNATKVKKFLNQSLDQFQHTGGAKMNMQPDDIQATLKRIESKLDEGQKSSRRQWQYSLGIGAMVASIAILDHIVWGAVLVFVAGYLLMITSNFRN